MNRLLSRRGAPSASPSPARGPGGGGGGICFHCQGPGHFRNQILLRRGDVSGMVKNETTVDEFSPNMIIRQVKSDSMHHIPVKIENVGMRAVVDTTDALMISDRLYKDFDESLPLIGS